MDSSSDKQPPSYDALYAETKPDPESDPKRDPKRDHKRGLKEKVKDTWDLIRSTRIQPPKLQMSLEFKLHPSIRRQIEELIRKYEEEERAAGREVNERSEYRIMCAVM
ncbi:hypothetical protein FQN53_006964 [Emmonsiellopsis sp. PD_33]|nr:hypothetical protein FQN53_006964 [Emmonsiellopsis sp. PD_33]